MSETTFDWNSKVPAKAEEREFALPPIGEYNFMVVSAEKTFSSNGNPMIKVRLDLQGADGSVFDNLVISDKMMWKLVSFFESIGLKQKGEELSLSIGDAADKAVGLEGFCKIKHETYNGEKRAKVDKYLIPTNKKPVTPPAFDENADMPFSID